MKFVTLDVKTANSDLSSICEIGIGVFEDDKLVDTHIEYIDPETLFDPFYTEKIHGISEEWLKYWFSIDLSYDDIRELLINSIVAHHSQPVCKGFLKALDKYDLEPFPVFWLDTEKVACITWQKFSEEGCSLRELAIFLGIEIGYPDAVSCSVAIGKIVIEACKKSGIGVPELLSRVKITTT
jgi:DNA polymerase-3 subunit epsilon